MCYRRCRWEDREGECRYRGAVPPCERRAEKDEDVRDEDGPEEEDREEEEAAPDWWDGEDDDYEGRDPDAMYDEWVERRMED